MRGKPRKATVRGEVRWYVDADDPLTRKRRRRFFETETAAKEYQEEVNRRPVPARQLNALVDPDVALGRFAAAWLWDQVGDQAWTRPGTINCYREHARRVCDFHVGSQEPLGGQRVRDLTAGHVAAFVAGMRRDGYAARTTSMSYRVFHQLLDRAVGIGLLPTHPVTRDFYKRFVKPKLAVPKGETVRAFTEAHAQQFLQVTAEHSRLHDFYITGFLTGCRLGELCGLRLSDDQVNLVAGHRVRQLFVERHLTRASTVRPVVGPTKNGATRHVDVGTDLGRVLDRLRAERPKLALKHGWRPVPEWLFVSGVGHPYDQTSIRRNWDRMLKLAGLGDTGLTPHSMRHSFATWHIARGRHAKWVSQQLGHAKISITLNLYAKWFAQVDTQAADALGSALLGNGLGNGTGS